MTVKERTKEIGIRKSIGAKRRSILMQFLAEAVALSLAGGVAGVAIGVGGGNAVAMAMNTEVTFPWLWTGIGLAVLVTAVSAREKKDVDFLPLTVEYKENLYAAGRIPGGYFRREGKLTAVAGGGNRPSSWGMAFRWSRAAWPSKPGRSPRR